MPPYLSAPIDLLPLAFGLLGFSFKLFWFRLLFLLVALVVGEVEGVEEAIVKLLSLLFVTVRPYGTP